MEARLRQVLPGADRFSAKEGDPPVYRAFGTDPATGAETLVGYGFLTSDFPPEEMGYNGPIRVLVGMDLTGRLTGALVLDYNESHRATRGDFLRVPGFQEQFAGKTVRDAFRVRRDVAGISGATISVAAMSRGIRATARRVAVAYLPGFGAESAPILRAATVSPQDLERLSWVDIAGSSLVQTLEIDFQGRPTLELSALFLRTSALAVPLLGEEMMGRLRAQAGERLDRDHLFLIGVEGSLEALFRPQVVAMVQGTDTLRFGPPDMIDLGAPRGGRADGQFRSVRALLAGPALDVRRPFTLVVDMRPQMGMDSAEFPGLSALPVEAPVATSAPADPQAGAPVPAGDVELPEAAPEPAPSSPPSDPSAGPAAPMEAPFDAGAGWPAFEEFEDQSLLARTLETTSWPRVFALLGILGLASVAFARKHPGTRWAALGATLLYLGFLDGGFLSVSHILGAVKLGSSVVLSDLPLLMLVVFTVGTTLLWGRVFCGFLCPFGALQDLIERVVPARFRRELPAAVHRRAYLLKYVVLAGLILTALFGTDLLLYQYFEPFGTVFFLSGSIVLWSIAGAVLLAAAVVPRFYCRYLCPLGAALAAGSLLSPLRIRRVEQCEHCVVCERTCPTGAIERERITFHECVRCNGCEIRLIEKAGVCRHDMERIRPLLVQIAPARRGVAR